MILEPRFQDGVYLYPVRVYFEDTDAGGIVYHSNYLKYAERARTEMMRCFGLEHSAMMAAGAVFAVRAAQVEFLRPARLDEVLEVSTRVARLGGATLVVIQEVRRGAELLVGMTLRLACMSLDARPARIPSALRERLTTFLSEKRT